MTLVVVSTGRAGLALATDSAVTVSYGKRQRLLVGAKKAFRCPQLRVAIGIWGAADLAVRDDPQPIPTDFLVEDVLEGPGRSCATVTELANTMARDLASRTVPSARPFGAVLAGYDEGDATPVVLQVENATIGEFVVRRPRPASPQTDSIEKSLYVFGDQEPVYWFSEIWPAVDATAEVMLFGADNGLELHAQRLAFFIDFIAQVYQLPNRDRSIGGPAVAIPIAAPTHNLRSPADGIEGESNRPLGE